MGSGGVGGARVLEDDDELLLRLIQRATLVARHRALQAQFPAHAAGFRKMEIRHRAVGAALMIKLIGREVDAARPCRCCGRY